MYQLVYLQLAKEDMEHIIYYIRHNLQNKTAATNIAHEFIRVSNSILEFPYGNAEYIPIKPLKNQYRSVKVKNFILFYIINEESKTITIARVLYQKRDLERILN